MDAGGEGVIFDDPIVRGRKSSGYRAMLDQLGRLKRGERLIYHREPADDRPLAHFAAVHDAAIQGIVTPHVRRNSAGQIEHLVERR